MIKFESAVTIVLTPQLSELNKQTQIGIKQTKTDNLFKRPKTHD